MSSAVADSLWVEKFSEKHKKPYWKHKKSGETVWKDPNKGSKEKVSKQGDNTDKSIAKRTATTSQNAAESGKRKEVAESESADTVNQMKEGEVSAAADNQTVGGSADMVARSNALQSLPDIDKTAMASARIDASVDVSAETEYVLTPFELCQYVNKLEDLCSSSPNCHKGLWMYITARYDNNYICTSTGVKERSSVVGSGSETDTISSQMFAFRRKKNTDIVVTDPEINPTSTTAAGASAALPAPIDVATFTANLYFVQLQWHHTHVNEYCLTYTSYDAYKAKFPTRPLYNVDSHFPKPKPTEELVEPLTEGGSTDAADVGAETSMTESVGDAKATTPVSTLVSLNVSRLSQFFSRSKSSSSVATTSAPAQTEVDDNFIKLESQGSFVISHVSNLTSFDRSSELISQVLLAGGCSCGCSLHITETAVIPTVAPPGEGSDNIAAATAKDSEQEALDRFDQLISADSGLPFASSLTESGIISAAVNFTSTKIVHFIPLDNNNLTVMPDADAVEPVKSEDHVNFAGQQLSSSIVEASGTKAKMVSLTCDSLNDLFVDAVTACIYICKLYAVSESAVLAASTRPLSSISASSELIPSVTAVPDSIFTNLRSKYLHRHKPVFSGIDSAIQKSFGGLALAHPHAPGARSRSSSGISDYRISAMSDYSDLQPLLSHGSLDEAEEEQEKARLPLRYSSHLDAVRFNPQSGRYEAVEGGVESKASSMRFSSVYSHVNDEFLNPDASTASPSKNTDIEENSKRKKGKGMLHKLKKMASFGTLGSTKSAHIADHHDANHAYGLGLTRLPETQPSVGIRVNNSEIVGEKSIDAEVTSPSISSSQKSVQWSRLVPGSRSKHLSEWPLTKKQVAEAEAEAEAAREREKEKVRELNAKQKEKDAVNLSEYYDFKNKYRYLSPYAKRAESVTSQTATVDNVSTEIDNIHQTLTYSSSNGGRVQVSNAPLNTPAVRLSPVETVVNDNSAMSVVTTARLNPYDKQMTRPGAMQRMYAVPGGSSVTPPVPVTISSPAPSGRIARLRPPPAPTPIPISVSISTPMITTPAAPIPVSQSLSSPNTCSNSAVSPDVSPYSSFSPTAMASSPIVRQPTTPAPTTPLTPESGYIGSGRPVLIGQDIVDMNEQGDNVMHALYETDGSGGKAELVQLAFTHNGILAKRKCNGIRIANSSKVFVYLKLKDVFEAEYDQAAIGSAATGLFRLQVRNKCKVTMTDKGTPGSVGNKNELKYLVLQCVCPRPDGLGCDSARVYDKLRGWLALLSKYKTEYMKKYAATSAFGPGALATTGKETPGSPSTSTGQPLSSPGVGSPSSKLAAAIRIQYSEKAVPEGAPEHVVETLKRTNSMMPFYHAKKLQNQSPDQRESPGRKEPPDFVYNSSNFKSTITESNSTHVSKHNRQISPSSRAKVMKRTNTNATTDATAFDGLESPGMHLSSSGGLDGDFRLSPSARKYGVNSSTMMLSSVSTSGSITSSPPLLIGPNGQSIARNPSPGARARVKARERGESESNGAFLATSVASRRPSPPRPKHISKTGTVLVDKSPPKAHPLADILHNNVISHTYDPDFVNLTTLDNVDTSLVVGAEGKKKYQQQLYSTLYKINPSK